MDPNACVERINLAIGIEDWDEVESASRDLIEWLLHGGFQPVNMPDAAMAIRLGKGKKEATTALYQLGRLTGLLLKASRPSS